MSVRSLPEDSVLRTGSRLAGTSIAAAASASAAEVDVPPGAARSGIAFMARHRPRGVPVAEGRVEVETAPRDQKRKRHRAVAPEPRADCEVDDVSELHQCNKDGQHVHLRDRPALEEPDGSRGNGEASPMQGLAEGRAHDRKCGQQRNGKEPAAHKDEDGQRAHAPVPQPSDAGQQQADPFAAKQSCADKWKKDRGHREGEAGD